MDHLIDSVDKRWNTELLKSTFNKEDTDRIMELHALRQTCLGMVKGL